jgi:hypothetical protein
MTHAHIYGCWVIRTICLIIKGTIQVVQPIVANDQSCKCRYLNWLAFSTSLPSDFSPLEGIKAIKVAIISLVPTHRRCGR